MEFCLLGALVAHVDGRPVDLGHPVQQRVLAALLVDANQVVPVDRLVDRVWDEQPPARARHTLYSHLSRLRRALGHGAIDRRTGGYTLTADPVESVDLHRFRRLVEQARQAADGPALALVERALRLWRGEPFAGLDSPWLDRLRERLRHEHLAARLLRNDLALRAPDLPGHDGLLPELLADAAAHPFDEHLAGQVMLALHRHGRSAEALRHYQDLRARMVEELGVDPGPPLRELHQRILTAGDEDTCARAAPAPAPRQLPAPPAAFVGRARELAGLDAALAEDPARAAVALVFGAGGVGKTWLALRWAHANRHRFPDGQLHVDLRGFDPTGKPLPESEVLHSFLGALGVVPERMPVAVDAKAALYRSLLADRRVLVVLDNAADPAQVRPLLPGSPSCRVLVTSRNRMAGLVAHASATPVALGVPSDREARELLRARLGARRASAEPDAVRELVRRTARLPLALGIVAARAVANPGFSLRALAEELRDEHGRLDVLTAGDPTADVRAVTSWSYRALTDGAARLFRLLGTHPGPDIDAAAAAALTGAGLGETRALLGELVGTNLLDEHVPGRYHVHDLLRAYAAERACAEEPGPARRAAVRRLLDHYLHTAFAAERHLAPHWPPITPEPPSPAVAPTPVVDYRQAIAWFTAEHACLLAAVALAEETGLDAHAWQLPWTLTTFLTRQGHRHQRVATQRTALAAAERLGDQGALAVVHHLLGRGHTMAGEPEAALGHLRVALALHVELGDGAGQALTHYSLASAWATRGRHEEAVEHARYALDLFSGDGNGIWTSFCRCALGWHHALLGEYDRALEHGRLALAALREFGDRDGEAHTQSCLGYAHHHLGHHEQALRCLARAGALFHELGDHHNEAVNLVHLGDAHEAAGDRGAAVRAWARALDILDRLGHADAAAVRDKLGARRRVPSPG